MSRLKVGCHYIGHLILITFVVTDFSVFAQNQTSESNDQVDESIGGKNQLGLFKILIFTLTKMMMPEKINV